MLIPAIAIWFVCEIIASGIQKKAIAAFDDSTRLRIHDTFSGMKLLQMIPAVLLAILFGLMMMSSAYPELLRLVILPMALINIALRIYISKKAYANLKTAQFPEQFYQAQQKASIISVASFSLLNILVAFDYLLRAWYDPGTWVTLCSRYIGNTLATMGHHRRRCPDAMERDIAYEPENTIHC